MPSSPSNDILHPLSLTLPNISETTRDLMAGEVGMLIWNTTTNKIDVCKSSTVAAASWGEVTSS